VALLSLGNGKVGRRRGLIFVWSLPAVTTCPGRTEKTCVQHCYALQGRFKFPAVADRLQQNLALAKSEWFAPLMIREIRRRAAAVVRVHAAGDFFSADYVWAWCMISDACQGARFYYYTRSFAVPELRGPLEELGSRANVVAWWSCDRDLPPPAKIPRGTRCCYLMVDEDEPVPANCRLVFRVRKLRRLPLRQIGGAPVCVSEREPLSTVTCETCRLCWRPSPGGNCR
jgi:hypothetical protein